MSEKVMRDMVTVTIWLSPEVDAAEWIAEGLLPFLDEEEEVEEWEWGAEVVENEEDEENEEDD